MDKKKLLAKQCANIERKLKAGKVITAREQRQLEDFQKGIVSVSRKQAAEFFGVSEVAVSQWAKKGCPFSSLEDIADWREEQRTGGDSGDLAKAKLDKTLREVERLELIIKREKGEVICVETVREQGIRIASIWCAELDAMVSDLPGQVAGLSEAELQPRLKTRIETLKTKIRHQMEAL